MRDTQYKIIDSLDELEQLISFCKQTGYASVDFETTSLAFHNEAEYPTILGVSFQPGSAWIIPLGNYDSPFRDVWQEILQIFGKEVMENPNIVKIGQNNKYEYKWFLSQGIRPTGVLLDTMLAKYLLDEERPHGLKEMVARYIPEFAGYALPGSNSDKFNWAGVPLEKLSQYCARDADFTFRLMLQFESRLMKTGFYPLFRNLLCMLTRVLGESEFHGYLVDVPYLDSLIEKYDKLISDNELMLRTLPVIKEYEKHLIEERKKKLVSELEDEIDQLENSNGSKTSISNKKIKIAEIITGKVRTKKDQKIFEPLNFGSPKQMGDFFFKSEHGLCFEAVNYTDSGEPSTDETTLLELKSEDDSGFIDALLKNRELKKLNSTYIVGIRELIDERGYLHCSYLIHGTVTGRLSSTNPNMQNLPRTATNPDIRKMFIAPPGYLLVEVDYSQAELRVVAELSQDKNMCEMFNSGIDIHTATACRIAGRDPIEITKILHDESHPDNKEWKKARKRSKKVSFGILYGQEPPKLAKELTIETGENVTKAQASQFRDEWFDAFPKIKKWIDGQHAFATKHGYVYNIFGRKRRLHILNNPINKRAEFGKWLEALRQSVNAPIQGAASDFTQLTSIMIWEEILYGKLPSTIKQVATIHDAIVYQVEPKDIHQFVKRAIEIGTNPETEKYFGFKMKHVTMKLDAQVGFNYGQMKDYKEEIDYIKFYKDGTQH